MFAAAAYWVFERDRAARSSARLSLARNVRRCAIPGGSFHLKLGAFIRGQLLLIVFVAVVLSGCFKLIGLPYWLLVGSRRARRDRACGRSLVAVAVAIGVGFTALVHVALLAGLVVLAVPLLEDYLIMPRVLGHSLAHSSSSYRSRASASSSVVTP